MVIAVQGGRSAGAAPGGPRFVRLFGVMLLLRYVFQKSSVG
jgi:hypothetical protein